MGSKEQETIRSLTSDEVPLLQPCLESLAAFHNRVASSFRGMYPIMPIEVHLNHMKDHVNNGTAIIVGLFMPDGTLGGFGMASNEGAFGEIDYLFVRKELRGGRRGDRIMRRLLDFLRERNVSFVDINVVKGNPAAKFYEKFDFVPRSEILSRRL